MSKTIEALENDFWGEPNYPVPWVIKTHELRRKPIQEFTIEDLRFMIGENVGTNFILPLALERLEEDPLAKSNIYPEFLIISVLSLNPTFWKTKNQELKRVKDIGKSVLKALEEIWKKRQYKLIQDYGAQVNLEDCIEGPEDKLAELTKKFLEYHKLRP